MYCLPGSESANPRLCSGQTDIVVDYLQRFNESKICVNTKQLKTDIQDPWDGPKKDGVNDLTVDRL